MFYYRLVARANARALFFDNYVIESKQKAEKMQFC